MSTTTPDRADDLDTRASAPRDPWVLLERVVAGGLPITFILTMVAVAQQAIRPLMVIGSIFAVTLVLSLWRSRGAAIAIGVLASLYLVMLLAMDPVLVPNLSDPGDIGPFVTTVAQVLLSATGAVGLVGLLRRSAGTVAVRVLQVAGGVLAIAVAVSGVAAVAGGDEPVVIADGATTVTLRDIEFQPAAVQVPPGTTVTWEWDDGDVVHDVAGDDFASELKADGEFAHTFDAPGTYTYECTVHPGMVGRVIVTE